jgi:Protein of unknown function (DUF3422)
MGTDDGSAAGGGNRGFETHPWRGRVVAEIHARPFAMMSAPRIVIHDAFMTDSEAAEAARHRLAEWCDRLGQKRLPLRGAARLYRNCLVAFFARPASTLALAMTIATWGTDQPGRNLPGAPKLDQQWRFGL